MLCRFLLRIIGKGDFYVGFAFGSHFSTVVPASLSNGIEKVKSLRDPLVDRFGRRHTYLRISLTERCNLRCTYCMPENGVPLTPSERLLSTDEIIRLANIFAGNGTEKIRLTGGEPTVRKDLVEIVARLSAVDGIKEIGITSNGIVLARKLDALLRAGLTHLNISLDTLDPNKYAGITRRNGYSKVIKLIEMAENAVERLKLNCVVIRDVNDDEVADFVALTKRKNIDVRFIEYMPFGGNSFDAAKMVSYREMLAKIAERFPDRNVIRLLDGPNSTSKAYKVSDFKGQFGFITSMSEHFCATCNRLRITADGNLKVCLHGSAEVSLRDKLRNGATDAELTAFIAEALQRKKAQHAGMENLSKLTNRPMILIDPSVTTKFAVKRSLPILSFLIREKLISSNIHSIRPLSTHLIHKSSSKLSHLDASGNASMVDVSTKPLTKRVAIADAIVTFPSSEVFNTIFAICTTTDADGDHVPLRSRSAKGDVLAVARLAGIGAAKRTAELIPLCHHVPLSHAAIHYRLDKENLELHISARCTTTWTTGVEMEALMAAATAALTVYDMCKALSHSIVVRDLRLMVKRGGRSDQYGRAADDENGETSAG